MPEFKHHNRSVFYDTLGAGPAVVFQHGLGADRRQALGALSELRGCRVIGMDAPGHGQTIGGSGPYGFGDFADCVLGLMDHLGIESAVLGGISMGSGIGLATALRAPKRVRGLLLVRPAWLATTSPPNLEIVARIGHWIEDAGVDQARKQLEADPFYAELFNTNPNCAASIAGVFTRPQALESARVLHQMVDDRPFSSMGDLGEVHCPTLVVTNRSDPLHPMGLGDELARAIGGAQHEVVPPRYTAAADHQSALTQAIQKFLDGSCV